MTNKLAKAGIGVGGSLVATGTAMVATPATLVPGIVLVVVGALIGGASAVYHEKPRSAGKGQVADPEDPIPPSKKKPGAA